MTCIIAGYYDSGVAIIADRRALLGFRISEEEKIIPTHNGRLLLSFAGSDGLIDDYVSRLEECQEFQQATSLRGAINHMKIQMAKMRSYYFDNRIAEDDEEWEDMNLSTLVIGLENITSGKARIFHLEPNGYAEPILRSSSEQYTVMGDGGEFADSLMKLFLTRKDVSQERLAEIMMYVMIRTVEAKASVGMGEGFPDVFIIEDDQPPTKIPVDAVKQMRQKVDEINHASIDLFWKFLENPALKSQVISFVDEKKKQQAHG